MQARIALRRPARLTWLLPIVALLVVAAVIVAVLALAKVGPLAASAGPPPNAGIAYFQFGTTGDTLWLADPDHPSRKAKLLVAPHASEFGVFAGLSSDSHRIAYTALPPDTQAPTPDTPANLWLADVKTGAQPLMIDHDLDLLVKPIWTPDGSNVVFRRSDGAAAVADNGQPVPAGLYMQRATAGAQDHLLVADPNQSLFPVAFSPDGTNLLFVGIADSASDVYFVSLAGGDPVDLGRLSDGLTRDWTLSPDGTRLAYLAVTLDPGSGAVSSRAYVYDIVSNTSRPVTDETDQAFSPVWDAANNLYVSRLTQQGGGTVFRFGGVPTPIAAPKKGFDVPLLFSPKGALIVQSFDGTSAESPGNATLAVVTDKGAHRTIARGDVAFLGWVVR